MSLSSHSRPPSTASRPSSVFEIEENLIRQRKKTPDIFSGAPRTNVPDFIFNSKTTNKSSPKFNDIEYGDYNNVAYSKSFYGGMGKEFSKNWRKTNSTIDSKGEIISNPYDSPILNQLEIDGLEDDNVVNYFIDSGESDSDIDEISNPDSQTKWIYSKYKKLRQNYNKNKIKLTRLQDDVESLIKNQYDENALIEELDIIKYRNKTLTEQLQKTQQKLCEVQKQFCESQKQNEELRAALYTRTNQESIKQASQQLKEYEETSKIDFSHLWKPNEPEKEKKISYYEPSNQIKNIHFKSDDNSEFLKSIEKPIAKPSPSQTLFDHKSQTTTYSHPNNKINPTSHPHANMLIQQSTDQLKQLAKNPSNTQFAGHKMLSLLKERQKLIELTKIDQTPLISGHKIKISQSKLNNEKKDYKSPIKFSKKKAIK